MIVSASRRTDIPAFYADWFFGRLQEGFAISVNPYNPKQQKRVELSRNAVDGFVFWTKNPAPMLGRLDKLGDTPFYFNLTITPYSEEVEPAFALRHSYVVETAKAIAARYGPDTVVWRYDPVLLSSVYTPAWHIQQFQHLAGSLAGAAGRCVFSFYDEYAHIKKAVVAKGLRGPGAEECRAIAAGFAQCAAEAGMPLHGCCESFDGRYGILPGACIDTGLLSRIAGYEIQEKADRAQRPGCGCAQSVDIGAYNTCPAGCVYCYATRSQKVAAAAAGRVDTTAPALAPLRLL